MALIDEALQWVDAGYYVYPVSVLVDYKGKKQVDFPGNWRDSSRDEHKVRELFRKHPLVTGFAIDTGKSGVVVLDVDTSGVKDGLRNLAEAGITLPSTPMGTTTWSGGFHGFFRQPTNPVGTGQNKPVRNVDFRGQGGVVFAPGTKVYDDEGQILGEYVLRGSILPPEQLPTLPEGVASILREKPSPAKPEGFKRPQGFSTLREDQQDLMERFVQEDLDAIAGAVDGSRNEALGRTRLLADRYQKLGISFEEFQEDVLDAYRRSGGDDEKQATDWCRSSWKTALANPMEIPKTEVDRMADAYHQRLVAQRLARSRVSGQSARFVDSSSFVDWSVAPPPAEFWVSGVLPKGEQVVLYGRPEAGKTFTALAWAFAVAMGLPWFGRETTQGRTWFMAGEGTQRITSRVHALIEHHGTKPDPSMFRMLNHVPDLMNEHVIEQMAQRIAEDEVDLGFIDTLGRAMSIGGGDISSPPDAAQALLSLQGLSKYRPSFTPVVIHHPVKEGSMAGAYNLLAGVDVALEARVDSPGTGVLRFEKNKDGEKTTVCSYRWKSLAGSAVLIPAFGGPEGPPDTRSIGDPDQIEEDRRRREHG